MPLAIRDRVSVRLPWLPECIAGHQRDEDHPFGVPRPIPLHHRANMAQTMLRLCIRLDEITAQVTGRQDRAM
jgi:hypothetical protein